MRRRKQTRNSGNAYPMYLPEMQESIDYALSLLYLAVRETRRGKIKEAISTIYQNVYGNDSRDHADIHRRRLLADVDIALTRRMRRAARKTIATVVKEAMAKRDYTKQDAEKHLKRLQSDGAMKSLLFSEDITYRKISYI